MAKLKTTEQLIASYKKANADRKAYLANAAGFDSPEEYLAHLERKLAAKKAEPAPVETPSPTPPKEPAEKAEMLDMVIAFDTTGSMSSYLSSVKKKVRTMVADLFSKTPDLRIKIVAFGDYCDMRDSENFGNAYQVIELTDNQEDLIGFIERANNTGGGDGDEFYELVIKKVVGETDWREEAVKSFLLIGDADPHGVGYSYGRIIQNAKIDWKEECLKAKGLGIKIDTLSITGRSFYKEVSKITGGLNLDFSKSENLSQVVEGLAYVRTSAVNFEVAKAKAEATGDAELIGAYKSMTNIL